ncbi:MAG: UDP-N-acetylmuramoyl-L-alanyl-D-glutamate--2,6-diaminopimelate ligase, partial [Gemmatimonadales bacterium]|nr:UDP-N-acetylmuramoyl-L-alanyl-D-glutamate--2,6-diaminopimelate ligase [Gemmatimonadales bacterium]
MKGRTLEELVEALRREGLVTRAPQESVSVTGVSADSRSIAPANVFFAVRGTASDGHEYVADAVARGAAAVVVERATGAAVPEVIVVDGRRAARIAGQAWYRRPADELIMIGVTGTNGKTTTTALIRHLLNAGGAAGSIGTLGAMDGTGQPVPSTAGALTTPGPIDLQATLAEFVGRGTSHVAMEASSHSLDQGRLDGLCFRAAVFTNVSRDHLDYHHSMEEYLAAKLRLSSYLGLEGIEVVNLDDPAWQALPLSSRRVTFGRVAGEADVLSRAQRLDATGSRFQLTGRFGAAWVELPLLGEFNISNALAAAACALSLGKPLAEVVDRLSDAPPIPGRMEVLTKHPGTVIRDYAHTPDALARALEALRPLTAGRLAVLFGCGGDRDPGKRPMMGRVAARLADLSIVTSDNPRTEDPDRIIDDIERGMGGVAHRRFTDRTEAIRTIVQE